MREVRTRIWLSATLVLLAALAFAPGASAATFVVDSTDDTNDADLVDPVCRDAFGDCTVRAALQQANAPASPGQDVVTVPPGTYTLNSSLGELDVTSNVIVDGSGSASNTTIAQTPPGRVIEVTPAGTLDLRDATVRDGFLSADGGGILTQGTLTLRRVVVANNEANNEEGGGIAIIAPASGNTTILDSTVGSPGGGIPGNRAGGPGATFVRGGGIYHEDGTLTIRDSTIAGNRVDATPGSGTPEAAGGGIRTAGALTIENSTIRSNVTRADAGGAATAAGILHTGGQLSIRRSTVAQNEAVAIGFFATSGVGGILSGAPGLIEDSTISANRAQAAAGVAYTPSSPGQTLTVRRSAVTGNVSEGILATGRLSLESSTVSGNGAGSGLRLGAAGVVRASTITGHGSQAGVLAGGSAPIAVTGSILSGNAPNCLELPGGSVVSGGYNVESATSCGFSGSGDQSNANPQLGPLQSNGGPTRTHAIPSSSPARDAVTSGCPPPSTDQRGVARPQGPACDSGAFEIAVSPPQPAALDLTLSAKGKQKAMKLKVEVGCGAVACSVDFEGKGKVPTRAAVSAKAKKLKLKPKGVDVAAGATETVRLKFKKNRKTVKKVRALLKEGGKKARRAKVAVSAVATGAGGTDTAERKIKLKR